MHNTVLMLCSEQAAPALEMVQALLNAGADASLVTQQVLYAVTCLPLSKYCIMTTH
jgi:hypothetical protein